MPIMDFGHKSFIGATGLIERIEAKEKQMRPYRGLTKDGKWVYGWYNHHENKDWISDWDKGFPTVLPDGEIGNTWMVEVIPETVGQQVGLKDKNGKEAYHKDITQDRDGDKGIVEWDNERGKWYLKGIGKTFLGGKMADYEIEDIRAQEIIGDIHTTPNLLEQDNGK